MAQTQYGWMIAIDQHNVISCGSSGQYPCFYKSKHWRTKLANNIRVMQKSPYLEVYFLTTTQYSQEVCEMNMAKFIDYVRTHGIRY